MSIGRARDEEDALHTHDGVSVTEKNEMMSFAATEMRPEVSKPSEANQKQEDKYIIYHL